jgi:hypothetical protein
MPYANYKEERKNICKRNYVTKQADNIKKTQLKATNIKTQTPP